MISYKDLAIVAELAGEALMTESDAEENDCVDGRNRDFDAIQRVWDVVARLRRSNHRYPGGYLEIRSF